MDLELGQLQLRYEKLRRRNVRKEQLLVSSLAHNGQQLPVVVVGAGDGVTYVLVDGYKRVRALKRLREDLVCATVWGLDEASAVVLERLMRNSEADNALEQGWLLEELNGRFGLSHEELARRFDKSQSWVSRRLALVCALPREVQERVLHGRLPAHAAMRFMVPMARAKREDCVRLVKALGSMRPTTREVEALYSAWLAGTQETRELVVTQPALALRARAEARNKGACETKTAGRRLLDDFGILIGVSRRARAQLAQGVLGHLLPTEVEQGERVARQARLECNALFRSAALLLGGRETKARNTQTAAVD